MASGLTQPNASDPWAWNAWAQTQDPSVYGWQKKQIQPYDLGNHIQALQTAGLWTPEFERYVQQFQQAAGNGDSGVSPAAPDMSGLAGYQLGTARGPGNSQLNALFGPDGQQYNGGIDSMSNSLHAGDYAAIAAVLGGPLAAQYAGLGALGAGGETGALGTIAPGAAESGALTTAGQFTMPSLGAVGAPTATLGGETAALGLGQVGALGAGGTGALGTIPSASLGSSALGATPAATGYTLPALAQTVGTPAAAGFGDYASAIKAAANLVGGLGSAYTQGNAAQNASQLQQQAAQAGQAQLAPYAQAGVGALKAQQDLAGLNGPQAQQQAIQQLQQSPAFTSQLDLGNRSILANASATGGLRGGNTEAALAQFSPALLAQTIQQQYGNLGTLAANGQNAAGGVANLIQQGGSAAAGGALAQGKQQAGYWGALGNAAGLYAGLSGW